MIGGLVQSLEGIAEELNITDSELGRIEKSYNAVADWLRRKDGELGEYDVEIFSQGSVKLGTVVKPIMNDDYDIDLVCELRKNTQRIGHIDLKELVGNRLKENATYVGMVKEGKRCWTLTYCDELNYHVDILPAKRISTFIPIEAQLYGEPILATDKKLNDFITTNPKGYADWFKSRMSSYVQATYERGAVESIPEYPYKTPLQRVVQLLKRHRDVYFKDDFENKPISIVITTLCGLAYNSEENIIDALRNILNQMECFILRDNDEYSIKNPTLPAENFAEKWNENSQLSYSFFNWLGEAKQDIEELCLISDMEELKVKLYKMFESKVVDRALNKLEDVEMTFEENQFQLHQYMDNKIMDLSHRAPPPIPLASKCRVGIKCTAIYSDGASGSYHSNSTPLDKNTKLQFKPIHSFKDIKQNHVKWQITNTGFEAMNVNCLRGDFELPNIEHTINRKETVVYKGSHIVQCFIYSNRQWHKSNEFIVNVK